jgi:hypothetical protein
MHTGPLVISTKPSLWLTPLAKPDTRLVHLRVYASRDNSRKSVPSPSLHYSLTHTHRSIGYLNQTQSLVELVVRLMYLRVYVIRDTSRKSTPYPSLCYSVTHPQRSIGYRNQTQPLAERTVRLMYLRVYDSRDNSRQSAPYPSLSYSLTHPHRSVGYHNQTQTVSTWFIGVWTTWTSSSFISLSFLTPTPSHFLSLALAFSVIIINNLPAFSVRLMCILCVPDDRDSACVTATSLSPLPPSSRSSLTHTNRFLGFRNSTSTSLMPAPTSV